MEEKFSFNTLRRCFIIAEAGTSHCGDLLKAQELIYAAKEAGADCIKFQLVIADEIIHPKTGTVRLPGGEIPLYETFRALERPPKFYAVLKETAEQAGLTFLCTPFGIQSARILRDMGVKLMKIASPELNHLPLLEEIAKYGLPVILSTGVSTLGDIDEALTVFRTHFETGLLHCITAYPAPEEEYNLRVIPHLATVFGVPVGVSDHSLDPLLVPAVSKALGARIVEKHICLDRSGGGLDDPVALEPKPFGEMARTVRRVENLLHDNPHDKIINDLRREYGSVRVDAALGDGIKRLSPAERDNYGKSNRSVHAVTNLAAGTVLNSGNMALLRSEKNLRPGLHPRYSSQIQGKRLARPVDAGAGITWDDVLP